MRSVVSSIEGEDLVKVENENQKVAKLKTVDTTESHPASVPRLWNRKGHMEKGRQSKKFVRSQDFLPFIVKCRLHGTF